MLILSHRGYWQNEEEKNREISFERSFSLGFGTETDIRDYKGKLVISHDMADENSVTADRFFQLYSSCKKDLPLALNIKADGLQKPLLELLQKYSVENYFLFDMSIPDALVSVKKGLNIFTRQSEYEKDPALYEDAAGVWLDGFHGEWHSDELSINHIKQGKQVCVVSPDLHKREHRTVWEKYRTWKSASSEAFMLCTDHPEEARRFFHEKH